MEEQPALPSKFRTAFEYARSSFGKEEYGGDWLAESADQNITSEERTKILDSARQKYAALKSGWDNETTESTEADKFAPRVSVIVPIYSGENQAQALALMGSLLDSSEAPPTEIVAVINGPETGDALRNNGLAQTLEQIGIKTVYQTNASKDKNRNIFRARQTGLEASEGNQILNVDADTKVSPGWIRNLSQQLEVTPFAYGPVKLKPTSELVAEKPLIAVSIIAKAGKILSGLPPFAGHNHAFRKDDVLAITEKPYELIVRNELELPHRLSEVAARNLEIGYVDGAGVITPFGHAEGSDSSLELIKSYFRDTLSRNLKHMEYRRALDKKLGRVTA